MNNKIYRQKYPYKPVWMILYTQKEFGCHNNNFLQKTFFFSSQTLIYTIEHEHFFCLLN